MRARVHKLQGIRGFTPTTYAVYFGERVLKIFLTKTEAVAFAAQYNKEVEA